MQQPHSIGAFAVEARTALICKHNSRCLYWQDTKRVIFQRLHGQCASSWGFLFNWPRTSDDYACPFGSTSYTSNFAQAITTIRVSRKHMERSSEYQGKPIAASLAGDAPPHALTFRRGDHATSVGLVSCAIGPKRSTPDDAWQFSRCSLSQSFVDVGNLCVHGWDNRLPRSIFKEDVACMEVACAAVGLLVVADTRSLDWWKVCDDNGAICKLDKVMSKWEFLRISNPEKVFKKCRRSSNYGRHFVC